ncbi:chromosome segregation protein SMC [Enterocloster alcoholdehydrogenati]|uniref:Chromosome partition protein Smc n=1 Tax=Enterocloster alcoholdehydrogenati TaxID=2547410 RepID=A0ABQ0AXJ1_9FIRM
MYLKSIEIQGFKSFANKLVFEFHNGITGIVGPNGSGKSNVADAVRWVLGEQRIRQLRGASMQDVIFSGTELRKPQGFAYVAITLDNSDHQLSIDYDEVTVSRRLYRSGESEYMINGSACRLKDINELFYDTGIGKEGYSIIGQGQIDKILSGKPDERRELFDEAAGIVKYKRRKAIAQKKLEDEKASLVRVSDILSELEKQVGPLERQSKAAREYLQLKEKLKICDANQFLLDTEHIQGQLAETGKKKTLLEGDLEESRKKSETVRQEYDQLETAIRQLEGAIEQERNRLNQVSMEKNTLEGRISVLKEQIHTEEMNEEHLKNRREVISQDLTAKEEHLVSYEKERTHLESQNTEGLERLEEAKKEVQNQEEEIRELEALIDASKAEIIRCLNEKAELAARQQRYEAMLEQVNLRRSEVSQKLLRFKSDESVQEERISQENERLSLVKKELEEKQFAAQEAEDAMTEADKEVRRLNRRLNDTQQEYHMAHTRLESLRNLAERYDGYGNSIRRVMEVRDRIHGIHGVVADLIATRQSYETAIETALGGSIQNIVTDSETTAKQLIEYLKKNKYGRATFLPLTSIGNGQAFPKPEALKEKGVIGLASDLVETKEEYQGLVRYLLGRVVVASDIDAAIALAKKYRYSLRIVTLEGELLSPGGSMTGGAFKNSSNLLGRRREIEELEQACSLHLKQAEIMQTELSLAEAMVQEKKDETQTLKAAAQKLALEENTLRVTISRLEEKKDEIAESSLDLVREHGQLEIQVREISESRQNLSEDTKKLESQSSEAEKRVGETSKLLENARIRRDGSSEILSGLQLSQASLSQKLDFIRENQQRIRMECKKLKEEFAALESGSGDSKEAVAKKEEEIRQIYAQIEASVHQTAAYESAISHKTIQKEDTARKQRELFSVREEISARITELDKDMFRLQSQEEKLSERLEAGVSYLWSEYEMTAAEAQTLKKDTFVSLPGLQRQIEELKARIRGLGSINVNAIEDYREVSERYNFMKNQHEDLVAAQAELEKIILELDAGMRRQFKEKFSEIRAEFDRVFKELFGGGRGTLELMEEEDILEAGIQIIAQPPGKKLQNMMQLSGGEKALTAISLLFAIQNLKPSPFCLLDEIEAALDDSNVDRFAGYLHKLTKNTQFIVITHRRGTMMSADRLYGITMQEKGVSALVSVKLIEDSLTE